MATTKTLTPTNQAITLAAFTEKPDNRTNVTNDDKLADAVNALNSNIGNKEKYLYDSVSNWVTLTYNVTYTVPCDGYIRLMNQDSDIPSEVNINGYSALKATKDNWAVVMVRKGMDVIKNTNDSSSATFIPFG